MLRLFAPDRLMSVRLKCPPHSEYSSWVEPLRCTGPRIPPRVQISYYLSSESNDSALFQLRCCRWRIDNVITGQENRSSKSYCNETVYHALPSRSLPGTVSSQNNAKYFTSRSLSCCNTLRTYDDSCILLTILRSVKTFTKNKGY